MRREIKGALRNERCPVCSRKMKVCGGCVDQVSGDAAPLVTISMQPVMHRSRRDQVGDCIVEAAKLIAARTSNPLAVDYAEKLYRAERAVPEMPMPRPYARREGSGALVTLLPLLEEDRTFGRLYVPGYQLMMEGKVAAACYRRWIVLSEKAVRLYSQIMLGLVALHEVVHVKQHNWGRTPISVGLREEAEAFEFELTLIEQFGGGNWHNLVVLESQRWQKYLRINGNRLSFEGYTPFKTETYQQELERVYGCPAYSPSEAEVRSYLLRLGVYRHALRQVTQSEEAAQDFFAAMIGNGSRYGTG